MIAALLVRRNRRTSRIMAAIALMMLGLGFAAVPIYRIFCQATGFDGTTQRAEAGTDAPGAVVGKIVDVRFDANVGPGMGWRFEPEQRVARVAVGAREMAFFTAENLTDHPITGQASYNVTPEVAGKFFTKIQCFCFTEQTLKPHERVRMPVIYFVDPALIDDPDAKKIHEITLSYTFFPVDSGKTAS